MIDNLKRGAAAGQIDNSRDYEAEDELHRLGLTVAIDLIIIPFVTWCERSGRLFSARMAVKASDLAKPGHPDDPTKWLDPKYWQEDELKTLKKLDRCIKALQRHDYASAAGWFEATSPSGEEGIMTVKSDAISNAIWCVCNAFGLPGFE